MLCLPFLGRSLQTSVVSPSPSEEKTRLQAVLSTYPLFQDVEPGDLDHLIPACRFKELQDEEVVCHCPDASHDAFVLLKGSVSITRRRGEAIHNVLLQRPGAAFNLGPLLGLSPNGAGARALGKVELLALDSVMVTEMLQRNPHLGYRLIRNLGRLALDQCERQLERYLD